MEMGMWGGDTSTGHGGTGHGGGDGDTGTRGHGMGDRDMGHGMGTVGGDTERGHRTWDRGWGTKDVGQGYRLGTRGQPGDRGISGRRLGGSGDRGVGTGWGPEVTRCSLARCHLRIHLPRALPAPPGTGTLGDIAGVARVVCVPRPSRFVPNFPPIPHVPNCPPCPRCPQAQIDQYMSLVRSHLSHLRARSVSPCPRPLCPPRGGGLGVPWPPPTPLCPQGPGQAPKCQSEAAVTPLSLPVPPPEVTARGGRGRGGPHTPPPTWGARVVPPSVSFPPRAGGSHFNKNSCDSRVWWRGDPGGTRGGT